jgi:hypothetical protein
MLRIILLRIKMSYSLGREGMARLATWHIILQIYIKTRRHLCDICIWTSNFGLKSPTNHVNTIQNHGGIIPAQYRIYMSSRENMAPYDKAWRTLATACFPCMLQRFLVFTLSKQCVSHGFLSPHTTFTKHLDAQDLPCLIVFGCNIPCLPNFLPFFMPS